MKAIGDKRKFVFLLSFSLLILEGMGCLACLLANPSMEKNVWFWGYSKPMVFLIGMFLLLISGFFLMSIFIYRSSSFFDKLSNNLDTFILKRQRLFVSQVLFLLALLIWIGSLLFLPEIMKSFVSYESTLYDRFSQLAIDVFERGKPVLVWVGLFVFHLWSMVFIWYKEKILVPGFINWHKFYQILLLTALMFLGLFHWFVFYFRLYLFETIPFWYWKYAERQLTNEWLLLLLVVISVIGVRLIIKYESRRKIGLVIVFLLGFILMVGFGAVQGSGIKTLQENFVTHGRYIYAMFVTQEDIGVIEVIKNYEDIAQAESFYQTKPPGVLTYYAGMQRLSNLINPVKTYEERYERLSMFLAWVSPILSLLTLLFLFMISKKYFSDSGTNLTGLMYIFSPAFIVILLNLDHDLYPLMFVICVYLLLQITSNHSIWLAFCTGCVVYLSVFFSFSLLPAILFSGLWLFIEFLRCQGNQCRVNKIKLLISFVVGILICSVIFYFAFGYDPLLRYANAMAEHRAHKQFESGFETISHAFFLNNIEFAVWMGFPMALLFVIRLIRSGWRLLTRTFGQVDILMMVFVIIFVFLNLFGQTHSEVARLWLYLLPLVSFFSAYEIDVTFERKNLTMISISMLQLVSAFLLFKYQSLE